jgi:hypothetical protein
MEFREKIKFQGTRTAFMSTLTVYTFCKKLVLQNRQNNLTKWVVCTSKVVFSDTILEILGCPAAFCSE